MKGCLGPMIQLKRNIYGVCERLIEMLQTDLPLGISMGLLISIQIILHDELSQVDTK
jgi:hypothetical protein